MNDIRWQYKVIEIPLKLFNNDFIEQAESDLQRLGLEGWELVSVVQGAPAASTRLFLKRRAA